MEESIDDKLKDHNIPYHLGKVINKLYVEPSEEDKQYRLLTELKGSHPAEQQKVVDELYNNILHYDGLNITNQNEVLLRGLFSKLKLPVKDLDDAEFGEEELDFTSIMNKIDIAAGFKDALYAKMPIIRAYEEKENRWFNAAHDPVYDIVVQSEPKEIRSFFEELKVWSEQYHPDPDMRADPEYGAMWILCGNQIVGRDPTKYPNKLEEAMPGIYKQHYDMVHKKQEERTLKSE